MTTDIGTVTPIPVVDEEPANSCLREQHANSGAQRPGTHQSDLAVAQSAIGNEPTTSVFESAPAIENSSVFRCWKSLLEFKDYAAFAERELAPMAATRVWRIQPSHAP